jgi:hypothetical protein
MALPFYARQQNKDFNRGIDLHVQANQLPLVTRPGNDRRVESGLMSAYASRADMVQRFGEQETASLEDPSNIGVPDAAVTA